MNTPKTKVELDKLLKSTIKSISSSKENWIDYLTFIGRIYKYQSIDQLCIYSQYPEATAVATFKQWKSLGRYINKGSTAIRNYKDSQSKINAELFDAADTSGPASTQPRLWVYKPEHKEKILLNLMGENFNPSLSLTENIVEYILDTQNDNNIENLSKIIYDNNNNISIDEAKEICINLMAASTAFAVCSRLFLKTPEEINTEIFENIEYLQSDNGKAIETMLSQVSNKSEEILRNIERSVKNENIKTAARNYQKRNTLSTVDIAGRNGILYSADRAGGTAAAWQIRRTDGQLYEREQTERTGLDDNRRQMEQLSDRSGQLLFRPEGEAEKGTGEKIPASGIGRFYGGSTEKNENRHGERRDSTEPNVGNISAENTIEDFFDEEAKDNNMSFASFDFGEHEDNIKVLVIEPGKAPEARVIENTLKAKQEIIGGLITTTGIDEYIDVISADKYPSKPAINRIINGIPFYENIIIARIDHETGDYHSLTSEDIAKYSKKFKSPVYSPSPAAEQLSLFVTDEENSYQDDDKIKEVYIKDVLTRGSGFQNSKYRIYDYFNQTHTIDEKINFLKKEYGLEGSSIDFSNGHKGFYETFNGNLDIRVDTIHKKYSLSFKEAAIFITDLIKLDSYLSTKEKDCYPAYIENQNIIEERRLIAEEFNKVIHEYNDSINDYEKHLNLYVLTDCSNCFIYGERITYHKSSEGDEAIPLMQQALKQIINSDTHLADRAKSLLPQLAYDEIPIKSEQNNIAKINYTYNNNDNAAGTLKSKFANNIAALQTLKKIEGENRLATTEEQSILAKYVGWGGLSKAFDDQANDWHNEYMQLKQLLTTDEYKSARASTLTSFYTEQKIIRHIYTALESFGFKGGNVLEPAMGTGNFFSVMPQHIRDNSRLYGVEIDSISGRIAKQLYQTAKITIQGFENTDYPDNFFDVAVSNVPFGNFKLNDKRYDKYNLLIHDYFFAKAIDKVRPKGIIAFITSKGTLDKQNADVRKYIAQRADLIGAIRLPNTAFKALAGTDVTSDIIFLQKRENVNLEEPDWIYIGKTSDGIPINQYFIEHPHMVLGNMVKVSGPFGEAYECQPYNEVDYEELLSQAILLLKAEYTEYKQAELDHTQHQNILPADPDVRNYTFTVVDKKIYYRENSIMIQQDFKPKDTERIIGMHNIRIAARQLIEIQKNGCTDAELEQAQRELTCNYDRFVKMFGYINDNQNARVFNKDNDYNFISALENIDENGNCKKADIFCKRTINKIVEITSANNAHDALTLTINNRGFIDFEYMRGLYNKTYEEIIAELGDEIFLDPLNYDQNDISKGWVIKDEYLSGNDVRSKLTLAKAYAEKNPQLFSRNVAALEKIIPPLIEAGNIKVKLGTHWIDEKYFNQFMYELLGTPSWRRNDTPQGIYAKYNSYNSTWTIRNKSSDKSSNATQIYGTQRISAYAIIEESLNQKDVVIKDAIPYVTDSGKESVKYVVNSRETAIARAQQEKIRNAFQSWIFKDADRRADLVNKYNILFNSTVIRSYDGSRLSLPNLSPNFKPHKHQRDAVAKILSGGNTLLGYVVGAGKTASMIMGAYEQIRLGKATKCMFAVPNHITKQFAHDIYSLYPDAKALIVTDKDFEKSNRQRFLSRIAFSDVNMIVIGHSQFERIMMSPIYQKRIIEKQIDDILSAISQVQMEKGERFTIKQLEAEKKKLETKIEKLMDTSKKDSFITFEELGIDSIFIDEAHNYKNCAVFSKMRNVAGIGNSDSQKAMDMLMKTTYFNENHLPITFATGTPISNTMTEMYVMQRYLQPDTLIKAGIRCFDEWASIFGETQTALELAPEGNGYRLKTRFSKFHNLPELMQMFKQVADIRTSDMVKLSVPKIAGGTPHIITVQPTEDLLDWIRQGVQRCQDIRNRVVTPDVDNMLKFTLEAKLAGLDLRILNPQSPFNPNGKIAVCAKKIYMHYSETNADKGVQIVFCDSSTPNSERFNAYDELKRLCIEQGIKADEVAFIHDAKSDKEKEELFSKCRNGEIRVLIGSTAKCGAGTNIQERLIALHHLDCPYRPSDIEQREGRILRQGNNYPEVHIYRYVTEKSFDAYLWNILVTKQRFISQIMTSKSPQRESEDIDEAVLSFEAVKAQASGDPRIIEKMNVDNEVSKLQILKAAHLNQIYQLQDELIHKYPPQIERLKQMQQSIKDDIILRNNNPASDEFQIKIYDTIFDNRENAGKLIIALANKVTDKSPDLFLGLYRGFKLSLHFNQFTSLAEIFVDANGHYIADLNPSNGYGNIIRIENIIKGLEDKLEKVNQNLAELMQSKQTAEAAIARPFEQEDELQRLLVRQAELNSDLDLTETADIIDESDLELAQNAKTQVKAYENECEDDLEI